MTTVNRYNENGSENLDWWFGVRESKVVVVETTNDKPRYVRYTLDNLKKRSTKRLSKMFNNVFGYLADRYTMIEKLFSKLNEMWDNYNRRFEAFIKSLTNDTNVEKKRGRKQKFSYRDVVNMIADREWNNMTVTELAKKYNTNIATVSQTLNIKGTYAFMFDDEIAYEQEVIQMMK